MTDRLITFAEAETIGEQMHDHWEKMAGEAPMTRDDTAWGDLVQFVIRKANDVWAAREGGGSSKAVVTVEAARAVALYLEGIGQPKSASDIRRLCNSNASYRTTLQTLHRDNMELRRRLAEVGDGR